MNMNTRRFNLKRLFLSTIWHVSGTERKKIPRTGRNERESGLFMSGRYWDRTSDPHNVNVVLYR
jgi:hypothetical protein